MNIVLNDSEKNVTCAIYKEKTHNNNANGAKMVTNGKLHKHSLCYYYYSHNFSKV